MITYKVIPRKSPLDRSLPPKYYISPVRIGVIDLDGLVKLISDGSTVTEADVHAVLIRLVNVISQQLAEGKSVSLDKFGSFRISVNSEGAKAPDEVTAGLIKRAKIVFRPSKRLSYLLKTLEFKKIKKSSA